MKLHVSDLMKTFEETEKRNTWRSHGEKKIWIETDNRSKINSCDWVLTLISLQNAKLEHITSLMGCTQTLFSTRNQNNFSLYIFLINLEP